MTASPSMHVTIAARLMCGEVLTGGRGDDRLKSYVNSEGIVITLDLRVPPMRSIGEIWYAYSYDPKEDKIEYWVVTPDGLRENGFREVPKITE